METNKDERDWMKGLMAGLLIGVLAAIFIWVGTSEEAERRGFTRGQETIPSLLQATTDRERAQATKAGVAYYELNQQTGKIEFHYVDINRVIQSVAQQVQQQMRQMQTSPLQ